VFHRALFSADMPEHEAAAVLPKFRHESQLATMQAMAPQMFPVVGGRRVPTLVLGGDSDAFISVADMQATALFHGGELQILKDLPHGVMLDIHWRRAADPILEWLEERWG
jgi:pimeloyl-ACP methyl ester carboxylesterase